MSLYKIDVAQEHKQTICTPKRAGIAQTAFYIEGPQTRHAEQIVNRLSRWANEGPNVPGEPVWYRPIKDWRDLSPKHFVFRGIPEELWPIKPEYAKTIYGSPYARMRKPFKMADSEIVPFFGMLARDSRANIGYVNGQYVCWIELPADGLRVIVDLTLELYKGNPKLLEGRFQIIAYSIDP